MMIFKNIQFEAIGTAWTISLPEDHHSAEIVEAILKRIEAYDKAYSRFREDSIVSAMSRNSGSFPLPDDSSLLFSTYRKLYDLTNGQVTPLIGNMLIEAGYDASYSLTPGTLHEVPSWDDVFSYEKSTITMKQPWMLDFGAAGKGYLVDIIAALLRDNGLDEYIVDAGGDMFIHTDHPTRVGLEHPTDESQVIGTIDIGSGSICGSSRSRRSWGEMHHVLNPKAMKPVDGVLATWVLADNAVTADALTTALFFVSPETIKGFGTFEYCVVKEDLSFTASPKFAAGMLSE